MPLPEPQGRQREVLYLPARGHVVVLGTAGSGKTTLAIHRAAWLSSSASVGGGRTLLVTFNKTLVTYLRHLNDGRFRNVQVENYHRFARGYLNARGLMRPRNAIVDDSPRLTLIQEALSQVQETKVNPVLKRSAVFFGDEIAWISQQGLASQQAYVEAIRTGREDGRVDRRDRPVVWQVAEVYRELRAARGYQYDWHDVAMATEAALAEDCSPRRYRHVVIDEGQDFSPAMIRSLASAVPADGSLTFFGDMAQQIFGRRVSWRQAGLTIPKPWEFRDNYRNSRQIARLALAIARMPYYHGTPDLVEPVAPAADGPLPAVVNCRSLTEEVKFIVKQATEAARAQSVAILIRRREHEKWFRDRLPATAIRLHRDMNVWNPGPSVHYGTYHAAKGLEFDVVILPFLSKDYMPDPEDVTSHGATEATEGDGRLLYVGVTRARTSLIITHSGPLTSLFPVEPGLADHQSL